MNPKEIIARTGKHNGGMSFFINDEVQPCTSFKINENSDISVMLESAEVEIPAMARQGIMHCWVPIFIDWKGPGEYDFTDMDTRIQTVLKLYDENTPEGKSKAVIVVRIQAAVFSPPWYIKQAADDKNRPTNLIEFRNPWDTVDSCSVDEAEHQRFATQFKDYGSTFAISPGDPFWDTHAQDCLKAIVEHVRGSDYAHRVFGWLPCAFNTNEWFLRTFAAEASCDFSAPTQKAFKEHLQASGIDCGDNPVPSPKACHAPGYGEFLDVNDPEARLVEEFSLWVNNRFADIILKFASIIRNSYVDSPKLIGFFYGYTFGLSRLQNLSQCGQLALNRLLKSEDIDFICSPGEYFYRADEKPFTIGTVMGPFADSAINHNKLVFLEDDHPPGNELGNAVSFTTRDKWHDEMYFRRNLAYALSHGQQLWWYSLGAQWFKKSERQKIVGKLHQISQKAIKLDRSSTAEVAVVIDERSVSTMRFNPLLQQTLLTESHGAFFQTGAPFDCFELQSFLHCTDYSQFKVVVFLNLFRVDSELFAAIEKVKADGRTLLFSFAPGFLDDSNGERIFSTDSASKLAGMELVEKMDNPLSVWVDPERSPLMLDGEDIRYGWMHIDHGVQSPVLGIADPEVVPLGYLYSGVPGLGMKEYPEWTSVFSAAPCIPPKILKAILKKAGVHLYTESEDVIYTNSSMLAYVSSSRGEKELTVKNSILLEDAITGEEIKMENSRCKIFMKRHEVRIFWKK